jgi:signal transduction histidine kinase
VKPIPTRIREQPETWPSRQQVLLDELAQRARGFVRLRWAVPPLLLLGTLVARLLGLELPLGRLALLAALVLAYNGACAWWSAGSVPAAITAGLDLPLRRFLRWQVACDYLAMTLLVAWTGGAASPFAIFFIFHVIFTALLLRPRTAFLCAGYAVTLLGVLAAAQASGWSPPAAGARAVLPWLESAEGPWLLGHWALMTTALLLSAAAITSVARRTRRRVDELAEHSETILRLNHRLNILYAIGQTLVSLRRSEPLLDTVCIQLAEVLHVQGVAVKLLSEDGSRLCFAATHGLPAPFRIGHEIEVAGSVLNRRVLRGEPFVTGDVALAGPGKYRRELATAGIHSVLLVPLLFEGRTLGVLGAYCHDVERFGPAELSFFTLAADLVALALENARGHEEAQSLLAERERFLMRVAHNLRAPLAAMVSMLDVVADGYLGSLNERQVEHVRRAMRRGGALLKAIDELLLLTTQQGPAARLEPATIDVANLAARTRRTFEDEARQRGLDLAVEVEGAPGTLRADPRLLDRLLENLLANALRYTPAGGSGRVTFAAAGDGMMRIRVEDTGIGIPADALPRLGEEFYRAPNARARAGDGTGLGLAIVGEIVRQHGGRLDIAGEEGRGAIFTVALPVAATDRAGEVGGDPRG